MKLSDTSTFLDRKLTLSASASARKLYKAAASRISCQASSYSLNPSIASFKCQPADLPSTLVQSYDFLVLGSGIAGLTYALKVCMSMPHI